MGLVYAGAYVMSATNGLDIIGPAVMRPGKKSDSKARLGFVRLG